MLAFVAIAGLTVVAQTWLSERALDLFEGLSGAVWWAPLLWTPAAAAGIVWLTRRFAPGAGGSGIPQVMAALDPSVDPQHHGLGQRLRRDQTHARR